MDRNETPPSLIDCLDTGDHGLVLDLVRPEGSDHPKDDKGPFSKRIFTHIRTHGRHPVVPVVLLLQRSNYEPPRSMAPLNNALLDAAWRKAFAYHRFGESANGPILLKDQVDADGNLQAFSPLFYCRHTSKWFHPICPRCGLALTLCRDDAFLAKRGLPGYADSLERFLYCKTCAKLSPTSPFFVPRKRPGMPDSVQDQQSLILQYKHLLATLPEEAALPCRGCAEVEACYGSSALGIQRIEPVAFFPFYMLMLPAPTCGAADFIRMIAGDEGAGVPTGQTAVGQIEKNRFFYQDEDRQFLEILYLKLTFLAQVTDHLMPDGPTEKNQEFDFYLDSIGVDLAAPGAGLPAFWNFNARILDSVGSFQTSPFAPVLPEAPLLHFLAAVWFQTLLVNAEQKAETVFAEIGKLAAESNADTEDGALSIDLPDSKGMFSAMQVCWHPSDKSLPQRWNPFWEQALRLGSQLVGAGLKAGVPWDEHRFKASLEALRSAIKTEMFSAPLDEAPTEDRFSKSDRLVAVLGRILDKWQAQKQASMVLEPKESVPETPADEATVVLTSPDTDATEPTSDEPQQNEVPPISSPSAPPPQPPPVDDWSDDIEETVVLSSQAPTPPDPAPWSTPQDVPEAQSQWEDDMEETVVIKNSGSPPVPEESTSFDDAESTVVISPSSQPQPTPASTDPDADLAATIIQGSDGKASAQPIQPEEDMDATVVIGPTTPPPTAADDDLEATMVQGGGASQAGKTPNQGFPSKTSAQHASDPSDLESTVVINVAGRPPGPSVLPQKKGEDEDLEATLIETPRTAGRRAEQPPPMPPDPPKPPQEEGLPKPNPISGQGASDNPIEDDDIMEETVIIRSDTKKE